MVRAPAFMKKNPFNAYTHTQIKIVARKCAPDTFLSILPISENGFYVQFIMEVKICECSQLLLLYVSVKLVITHENSLFLFISSVFVFKPPQISVH